MSTSKQKEIDNLISLFIEKFEFECANPNGITNLFIKETNDLVNDAKFLLKFPEYLHLLSNYGDIMITTNSYSIIFYGFGYWDGTSIRDYPLTDKNGMYVFADLSDKNGDLLLFAFDSFSEKAVIRQCNEAEGDYKETNLDLIHFLELIVVDNYQF